MKFAALRIANLAVPLLALAVSACAERPAVFAAPPLAPPPRPISKPLMQKPAPPAHAAAPIVVAGPAGQLTIARVGSYMDALENELRRRVHGHGIVIARMGDDISVVVPSDRLFTRDGMLDADDVLEPLGAVLDGYLHTSVTVSGFTDTAGAPDQNMVVSQKRARTIADALAHEGVAAGRITSQGFGETHLKIATGDSKKEARNRRIEILLKPRPG